MKDSYPFPIARIGLVGGGQLGRMMVKAAKRLGCTCVVLDPYPKSPAGQVAGEQIIGGYHDPAKLRELAESCDVVTYELEDIDTETLRQLELEGHKINPAPALLSTLQDKLTQKRFLSQANIPTAEFIEMAEPNLADFESFGFPLVQKARRGGYDGRGVSVMLDADAFNAHLPVPSLVERFIEADKELAVMVARRANGDCVAYPTVEMCFRAGENVLDLLLCPAKVDRAIAQQAEALAMRTINALEGVGMFGVELFLTADGELLVNEIAPRTHNSGHHTIEACITDQFEQHLRAVLDLPLGSTEQLAPAAMINLLGEADAVGTPVFNGLQEALAIPGVCLHIYGKAEVKPFRKMGHVTVIDQDLDSARTKAEQVRDIIQICGEQHP
ncbi:MAG: 5-(carboxyamino)imidazole ribonucleotide synthase [Candidatus Thiodiazotropha sp. 6PLUC2]